MAKNGLVWIATGTASAAASLSIDNCFSATYTHYVIKRNLLGSTALNALRVRLRASGTDDSGANYRLEWMAGASTVVSANRQTAQTQWSEGFGYTEATSIGFAELWISNPFEAVRTTAWCDMQYDASGAAIQIQSDVMAHDLTTSYTGFTVIPAAGTITGTVSVFGLVTA